MSDLFRKSSAILSPCGLYRYRLTRTLDGGKGRLVWVMLNPSKADDEVDDPTIRRCIGFARSWDFASFDVVNLFAWRATDPVDVPLMQAPCPDVAVGPDNDRVIIEAVTGADKIIVAWGTGLPHVNGRRWTEHRAKHVLAMLWIKGTTPVCLGLTSKGQPRHPLMVKGDATLLRYEEIRPPGRRSPAVSS